MSAERPRKRLIPLPKSYFIRVRCASCGNEQVIFSHASRVVRCHICDEVLAEPTGGRARLTDRAAVMAVYGRFAEREGAV